MMHRHINMNYFNYMDNPPPLLPIISVTAAICGVVLIFLTIMVIRLRLKYKVGIGDIKKEIYYRRNGALSNFTNQTPIALVLLALAEVNKANGGVLFFAGGIFILARIVHAYSVYRFEILTKSYRLRTCAMVSTFAVILALAGLNLYKVFTNSPY